MSDDLPAPLTPPECDLRNLDGFMLNVERMLASELWALSSPEEFKAAFALWCRAWKQVPAASLPDDDAILAAFSGAGKRWKKLRPMALRGFIKCSDGRLYHKTLAEDALRAMEKKEGFQASNMASVERKKREREERGRMFAELKARGITPEWNTPTRDLREILTRPVTAPVTPVTRDRSGPVTQPVTEKNTEPVTRPVTPVTPHVTAIQGQDSDSDRTGLANRKQPSTASAPEAAAELCEELNIRLENDPERLVWPGKIQQWLDRGGVLDDLLAAGRRSRARGDPPGKLGLYLKMSEDEKAKREAESGAVGDVKSPTRDYWLTHAEIRKHRRSALEMYASDGRWVANELPNGVWGDAFDTGPPPHDPRTKITDEMLDSVAGARAKRDKILGQGAS